MNVNVSFSLCLLGLFAAQGEKGEPGFVMGADGSMVSGLAAPVGPKGVKVIPVVTICANLFRNSSFHREYLQRCSQRVSLRTCAIFACREMVVFLDPLESQ